MSFGGRLGGRFAGGTLGKAAARTLLTFAFDNGLALPVRAIIQNGMVELLRRLDAASGGYLACLEPTSTIVRGGGDEQGLSWLTDQLGARTPAILVGIGDQAYSAAGDTENSKGRLQVPVYFVVNSMRGRLDRLTGDAQSAANRTSDPGVYVLLEHARQLLDGQKPGDVGNAIKELDLTLDRQLWADDSFEIWEQVYEITVSYRGNDNRDIALELKSIETYSRLSSQAPTALPVAETTSTVNT